MLKKLKSFLKEGDCDDKKLIEEVQKTVQELKTNDIRIQMLEMLSASKYVIPDALEAALNVVVEKLIGQGKVTDEVCDSIVYFIPVVGHKL